MICPKCGKTVNYNHEKCWNCGQDLNTNKGKAKYEFIGSSKPEIITQSQNKKIEQGPLNECNIKNIEGADSRLECTSSLANEVSIEDTGKNNDYIICKKCTSKNTPNSKFCNNCGTSLIELDSSENIIQGHKNITNEISCNKCNTKNKPNSSFCSNCGTNLLNTSNPEGNLSTQHPKQQIASEEVVCLKCKGTGRNVFGGVMAKFLRFIFALATAVVAYIEKATIGDFKISMYLLVGTVVVYILTIGKQKCSVCKGKGKVILKKNIQ